MPPMRCPRRATFWPARMWARCCWNWRRTQSLDLVASRRLVLAAEESGVTALLLREGADPEPSAALTRWQVGSAPHRAMMTIGAIPFSRRARPPSAGPDGMDHDMESQDGIFRKMAVSTRRILALWLPRLSTDRLIRKRDASRLMRRWWSPERANNALYVHALDGRAQRLDFIAASLWPMPGPWCSR